MRKVTKRSQKPATPMWHNVTLCRRRKMSYGAISQKKRRLQAEQETSEIKTRQANAPAAAMATITVTATEPTIDRQFENDSVSADSLQFIPVHYLGLVIWSVRALHSVQIYNVGDLLRQTPESVQAIAHIRKKSVSEILAKLDELKNWRGQIGSLPPWFRVPKQFYREYGPDIPKTEMFALLSIPEYHDCLLNFVRANDSYLDEAGVDERFVRTLTPKNYRRMSDVIFLPSSTFRYGLIIGHPAANALESAIQNYLNEHQTEMIAACQGYGSGSMKQNVLKAKVLYEFNTLGFSGISKETLLQHLAEYSVSEDALTNALKALLEQKELRYEDGKYYRVYKSFFDCLTLCPKISERDKAVIRARMNGVTLGEMGEQYDMTGERVRQIVLTGMKRLVTWYKLTEKATYFSEDYYRYFFDTYNVTAEIACGHLGIPASTYWYLKATNENSRRKSLSEALQDDKIDDSLREKIRQYLLTRGALIDGSVVPRQRLAMEKLAVQKLCQDSISFDDFCEMFNQFLEAQGIPYDPAMYCTPDNARSRLHSLSNSRYVLWRQNSRMRYYDVDSRDYTELLDALNLDSYENIAISTAKWFSDYPEIMEKYDIRDYYELHNLLRKIVPEGSYHNFHCVRMPSVQFGKVDRTADIYSILVKHAPISQDDLVRLVQEEFGYDESTIRANFLAPLAKYLKKDVYVLDQKKMSPTRLNALKEALTKPFYTLDEVKQIYTSLFPKGDPV